MFEEEQEAQEERGQEQQQRQRQQQQGAGAAAGGASGSRRGQRQEGLAFAGLLSDHAVADSEMVVDRKASPAAGEPATRLPHDAAEHVFSLQMH